MKGYPHVLNSKQDYINIIEDFGYNNNTKRHYEGLLNSATKWQFDKELDTKEEADQGEEYKVMTQEKDGEEKIVQYKLVDNPKGRIFKMGFTTDEVKEVIDKC